MGEALIISSESLFTLMRNCDWRLQSLAFRPEMVVGSLVAGQRQEGEMQMPTETVPYGDSAVIPSRAIDVLYLFARRVQWRKTCSEEAFWELLCARMSPEPDTRLIAQGLLRDC